jgi:hypothetical protein
LGARPDKSIITSEPSHSDLFHDVNSILSSILGSFKYPESTIGLSLKDDKQLKEICSKLNKYQSLSSNAFGFINILAKIISLKLTCEKYIQMSSVLENPFKDKPKVTFYSSKYCNCLQNLGFLSINNYFSKTCQNENQLANVKKVYLRIKYH